MGETYYEVLGVDPDADTEEIREAYRDRVLETHPDHNDAEDASERFALVTEAESVLTDETERARYDRLGHDAYHRWGTQFPSGDGAGSSTGADSGTGSRSGTDGSRSRTAGSGSRTTSTGSGASGTGSTGSGASGTTSSASGSSVGGGSGRSGSNGSGVGSHHARQRYRRRAATASETDWWFGDDQEPSYAPGSETGDQSDSGAGSSSGSDAGFAVHGWTDEVELDSPFRSLTERTAVLLGSLWLLYPLLVYSSLSPAFPTLVNATVTVCTLVLVGYLLTWPRVAVATFGSWSLLTPVLVPAATSAEVLSLVGVVVSAAFWVPFAIATANWWVLRH